MHEAIEVKAVKSSQVRIREMSESEPSDEVTKCQLLSKPDRYRDVRDECRGRLIIVCAATVIKEA